MVVQVDIVCRKQHCDAVYLASKSAHLNLNSELGCFITEIQCSKSVQVSCRKSVLQCFDAVGCAAGRASGL